MRGKSLALLILALGCGLVASLGITQVLAKRGEQSPAAETTPVYVAKADISVGTAATSDVVKIEQWPKDKVPAGALSRQEEIDGRRARYRIFSGQPILEPMLLHRGEVPLDGLIPKGLRVVAIPVGPETIQSGLVMPGSRCDIQVFMRADTSLGIGETTAKTILQDIRVFAVNDMTSTETNDPKAPETHSMPTGKTVSLLVTPKQAEIVTLASQLGTIRLVLRSAEDTEQTKISPLNAHELLGAAGGSDRRKENPGGADQEVFNKFFQTVQAALKSGAAASKAATPNRAIEPPRYTMRVRSGPDVSDVVMTASAASSEFSGDEEVWTTANVPARNTSAADSPLAKAVETTTTSGTASASPAKPHNEPSQPILKVNGKPPMGS